MFEALLSIAIPDFSHLEIWMSLLTLIFLEVVLGIDNILFISIISGKLPEHQQKKGIYWGLIMAMILRILILFGISFLISMQAILFTFDWGWMSGQISSQAIILFLGGIFLLVKSTNEIHHKMEKKPSDAPKKKINSLGNAIIQISLINLVFSIDSILTAVGLTSGLQGALLIMIIAVVVGMGIMIAFAVPVGHFVSKHPTIQILGLAFLILIGFMLITEGAHLSKLVIFDQVVGVIPKGYLYFTIAFSLLVEMLNLKIRKLRNPVKLQSDDHQANI